jgi:trimeric autotransporter adhesin
MASSLARQLAALQTETRRGGGAALAVGAASGLGAGRGRASFLYSPREAEALDTQTVFGIGANGLAELRQLDEDAFAPYAETLFSEAWADLDRELKTADVGARIDGQISSFCRILSPFLPLRAAHKALEWLIRRYKANVYNVNALMAMALPHCDTGVFGRLVQVLDLHLVLPKASSSSQGGGAANKDKDASSASPQQQQQLPVPVALPLNAATLPPGSSSVALWHFLGVNQRTGAPLPRDVLARQCLKDSAVLRFVCDVAADACAAARASSSSSSASTALTWYALTVSDVVLRAPAVTEQLLALLLPPLLRGLRDSAVPESQAAAYAIGAALLSPHRAGVSAKVFTAIATAAVVHADPLRPAHALAFLAAVFQGQAVHQGSPRADGSVAASSSVGDDSAAAAGAGGSMDVEAEAGATSQWLTGFRLPTRAVSRLLLWTDLANALAALAAQRDISVFLRCLLSSCVSHLLAHPGQAKDVRSLLQRLPAATLSPLVPALTRFLLSRYKALKRGPSAAASAASADAGMAVEEDDEDNDGGEEGAGRSAASRGSRVLDVGAATDALASVLRFLGQTQGPATDAGIRTLMGGRARSLSFGGGTTSSSPSASATSSSGLDADTADAIAWATRVLAGTDLATVSLRQGSSGSASAGPADEGSALSLRLALGHASAAVRERAMAHVAKEAEGIVAAVGVAKPPAASKKGGAAAAAAAVVAAVPASQSALESVATQLRTVAHALEQGVTDDDAIVVTRALAVHASLLRVGVVAIGGAGTATDGSGDEEASSSSASSATPFSARAATLVDHLLGAIRKWAPAAADPVEKALAGAAAATADGADVRSRARRAAEARAIVTAGLTLSTSSILPLADAADAPSSPALHRSVALALLGLLPFSGESVDVAPSEASLPDIRAAALAAATGGALKHDLFARVTAARAGVRVDTTRELALGLVAALVAADGGAASSSSSSASSSSPLLQDICTLAASTPSAQAVPARAKWHAVAILDAAVGIATGAVSGADPLGPVKGGAARPWSRVLRALIAAASSIFRDEWRSACAAASGVSLTKRTKGRRSSIGGTAEADAAAAGGGLPVVALPTLPDAAAAFAAAEAAASSSSSSLSAKGLWSDADTEPWADFRALASRAVAGEAGASSLLARAAPRIRARVALLAGALQRVASACGALIEDADETAEPGAGGAFASLAAPPSAKADSDPSVLLPRSALLLLSTPSDAVEWTSLVSIIAPVLDTIARGAAVAASDDATVASVVTSPLPFLGGLASLSSASAAGASASGPTLVGALAASRALELARILLAARVPAPWSLSASLAVVNVLLPSALLSAVDSRPGPAAASLRLQALALLRDIGVGAGAALSGGASANASAQSSARAVAAAAYGCAAAGPAVEAAAPHLGVSSAAALLRAASALLERADAAVADGPLARKALLDHAGAVAAAGGTGATTLSLTLAAHALLALRHRGDAASALLTLAFATAPAALPLWSLLQAVLNCGVDLVRESGGAGCAHGVASSVSLALTATVRIPVEAAAAAASDLSVVSPHAAVVRTLVRVFALPAGLVTSPAGSPLPSAAVVDGDAPLPISGALSPADADAAAQSPLTAGGAITPGVRILQLAIACVTPNLWRLACASQGDEGQAGKGGSSTSTSTSSVDLLLEALLALAHRGSPQAASSARHSLARLRIPAPVLLRYMRKHALSCDHVPAASASALAAAAAAPSAIPGPSFRNAAAVASVLPSIAPSVHAAMAWASRLTVLAEVLVSSLQAHGQGGQGGGQTLVAEASTLLPAVFSSLEILVALSHLSQTLLGAQRSGGTSARPALAAGAASSGSAHASTAAGWDDDDVDSTLEYAKQLLLTAAHHAIRALPPAAFATAGAAPKPSSPAPALPAPLAALVASLDPRLPIHVVYTSDSTQTRSAALTLLATMAAVKPAAVLRRLMPVFAALGGDALARDDSFTFLTMARLVEAVMPPLRLYGPAVGVPVHALLKVFAACVHTIPVHRQKPLYAAIVTTAAADVAGMPGAPGVAAGGGGGGGGAGAQDKSRFVPAMVSLLLAQHVLARERSGPSGSSSSSSSSQNDLGSLLPSLSEIHRGGSSVSTGGDDDASSLGPIPDVAASLLLRFSPQQQVKCLHILVTVAQRLFEMPLTPAAASTPASAPAHAASGPAPSDKEKDRDAAEIAQLMPLLLTSGVPASVPFGDEGVEGGKGGKGSVPSSPALLPASSSGASASSSSSVPAASMQVPGFPDAPLAASQRCAVGLAILRFVGAHMSGREFLGPAAAAAAAAAREAAAATAAASAAAAASSSAAPAPSTSSAADRMQKHCLLLSERVFDVLQIATSAAETANVARVASARQQRAALSEASAASGAGAKARAAEHARKASSLASLARFWGVVEDGGYAILDRLSALLPPAAFVAVVSALLQHDDGAIRRRSLGFLADYLRAGYGEPAAEDGVPPASLPGSDRKVGAGTGPSGAGGAKAGAKSGAAAASASAAPAEVLLFLQLIPDLLVICTGGGAGEEGDGGDAAMGDDAPEPEPEANRQTALETIAMLAAYFARGHAASFRPAVAAIVKLVDSPLGGKAATAAGAAAPAASTTAAAPAPLSPATRAVALVVLARLCAYVGPAAVPHIPVLVPRVLEAAEWSLRESRKTAAAAAAAAATEGDAMDEETGAVGAGSGSSGVGATPSSDLRAAALTAIRLLVAALPAFLSPFLPRLLRVVLNNAATGALPLPAAFVRWERLVQIDATGEPVVTLPPLEATRGTAAGGGGGVAPQGLSGVLAVGPDAALKTKKKKGVAAATAGQPMGGAPAEARAPVPAYAAAALAGGSSSSTSSSSTLPASCSAILALLPARIEARVLLPALMGAFGWASTSSDAGPHAVALLVRAVTATVLRMPRADLREALAKVFRFLLTAADYRWRGLRDAGSVLAALAKHKAAAAGAPLPGAVAAAAAAATAHAAGASVVEGELATLLTTVVVRLSDKQLKPLLLRLLSWATTDPLEIGAELAAAGDPVPAAAAAGPDAPLWAFASLARRIALYRLLEALVAVAKSLFVPYVALVLTDAAKELAAGAAAASADGGEGGSVATSSLALGAPAAAGLPAERLAGKKRGASGDGEDDGGAAKARGGTSKGAAAKRVRFAGGDEDDEDDDDEDDDEDIDDDEEDDEDEDEDEDDEEDEDAAPAADGEEGPAESASSVLPYSRLHFLDGLWNPPAAHAGPPGEASALSLSAGTVLPPLGTSHSVVPTTPHALRCAVLGLLRRTFVHDTGIDTASLMGRPAGGRERLGTVLRPLIAQLSLPLVAAAAASPSAALTSAAAPAGGKRARDGASAAAASAQPVVLYVPGGAAEPSVAAYTPVSASRSGGAGGVPGGRAGFDAFAAAYLLPIAGTLTTALRRDTLWKPLHNALLLATRDERARVRLAGVRAVGEVFRAGGDEALVLLPEALPFLAELQNDGDRAVEGACATLLHYLEEASGEDLQKYLA